MVLRICITGRLDDWLGHGYRPLPARWKKPGLQRRSFPLPTLVQPCAASARCYHGEAHSAGILTRLRLAHSVIDAIALAVTLLTDRIVAAGIASIDAHDGPPLRHGAHNHSSAYQRPRSERRLFSKSCLAANSLGAPSNRVVCASVASSALLRQVWPERRALRDLLTRSSDSENIGLPESTVRQPPAVLVCKRKHRPASLDMYSRRRSRAG